MANSDTPRHIAIIMDGNGRWARSRGLPSIAGHRAGVKAAQEIVEAASGTGVKVLTLFTFSTENWKRPKREVGALLKLLENYLDKETDKLNKNNIRFMVIGDVDAFSPSLKARLQRTIESTGNNTGLILNLALNYGGRDEILKAARAAALDINEGRIKPEELTEEAFSGYLYTKGLPDPDLLIRTSGEFRISNFLLWQISYAEIYVSNKLWPDFGTNDLAGAISEYRSRDRRFGG